MKNFLSLAGFRRLDHLPRNPTIVLGLVIGGLLGVYFTSQVLWVGVGGYLLVFSLAALLAYSGQPVAVSVEEDDDEEEDQDWVSIPRGHFLMGSEESERESPVHEVTISAFDCMRTTVTDGLYQAVMDKDVELAETDTRNNQPVVNVNWFDAVQFCNRWSEQAGLTPCYEVSSNQTVVWHRQRNGYRLLTEAEWVYVCRAGSEGKWCFGNAEKKLTDYAWFDKNSNGELQAVAQKNPNAWGLYDMHGNVWEWCWDWYGAYPNKADVDPTGSETGEYRVLRGGAFIDEARLLRSASRISFLPEDQGWDIGFRCARGPRRQP